MEKQRSDHADPGAKRASRHLPLVTRLFCLYLITNYEKVISRKLVVVDNKNRLPVPSAQFFRSVAVMSGDADNSFTEVLCD